jgi:hypothetical protein
MPLQMFDKDHEIVNHYICPECLGRTVIRWLNGRGSGIQIVIVDHGPSCITGKNAFNQVHHNSRKAM